MVCLFPLFFFIQPDSTQDCLIGMNVAPALGLSFLDNRGKPLRTRGSQSLTNASVNLIQTQPVPARSRSFVEAKVDAELGEGVCVVFEPNPRSLEAYGLGALESIMQVNNQGKVFVPIVNYHQRDVYMDEGTMLGRVEVYPDGVSDLTQSLESVHCDSSMESGTLEAGVAVVSADSGSQLEALLEAVQWPDSIAPQEVGQLKALITEYRDVFALSGDELGCTSVVQHNIDTGDHAPIKQYPRRTPLCNGHRLQSW